MAHSTVVQAVSARLAAGFDRCDIVPENAGSETPEDGRPFVVVDYPYSRASQASTGDPGNNWYREEGGFRVVLAVSRGAGTVEGRAWLDEIAALFRGQSFDGVRCYAPSSAATDDRNENGVYYLLAIAVPYDFDIIG